MQKVSSKMLHRGVKIRGEKFKISSRTEPLGGFDEFFCSLSLNFSRERAPTKFTPTHSKSQSRLSLKILPLGFSFHLRASVGRENRFSFAPPTSTLILSPPTKITRRRRSGAEFFTLIITFFDLELGKIFSGFF